MEWANQRPRARQRSLSKLIRDSWPFFRVRLAVSRLIYAASYFPLDQQQSHCKSLVR